MMGSSFLSLPYATAKSSVYYMAVLIIVNAVFNSYTARVLGRLYSRKEMLENDACAEQDVELKQNGEQQEENEHQDATPEKQVQKQVSPTLQHYSYAKAAHEAFGIGGELLVCLFIIMADVGASASYFIVGGDALNSVYAPIAPIFYILMMLALVLPCLYLPNVEKLSFVSTIGFVMFIALIVASAIYGLIQPAATYAPAAEFAQVLQYPSFIVAFGIVKFCFAGHEVVQI